jgi:AraC-like DNA-binding protein
MAYSPNVRSITPLEASPAVCRAGFLQFSGNRTFTNPCVQSRGIFWCKSGKGTFTVNGENFPLEAQDLYLLPWNRRISYHPDKNDPMFTGHVHLVPYYRPGAPWIPNVPHQRGDEAFDSPDRKDVPVPGLEGVVHFRINAGDNIALLLNYTIRCFIRSRGTNESEARHLGGLLMGELKRLNQASENSAQDYPEELLRMVAHVEARYMRSITVSELADTIGRSRSHVLKLFRQHVGVSAKQYIIDRQLKQACELLLSTTRSIAEVGQAVGISDPYHFSKLFRRHIKVSPTAFRTNHGPISQFSETQFPE